jgi:hypothetical protein
MWRAGSGAWFDYPNMIAEESRQFASDNGADSAPETQDGENP